MPLYEYLCLECGEQTELLINASSAQPSCRSCGSTNLKKLLSAHATLSGAQNHLPGPGDTPCCGAAGPQEAGCAGPGSCCGKIPS